MSSAAAVPEKKFRKPPSPRFRVHAELDNRRQFRECTVTVLRGAQVVVVRPLRSRRTYERTLADVAAWVYQSDVTAQLKASGKKVPKARRARR